MKKNKNKIINMIEKLLKIMFIIKIYTNQIK